MWQILGAGTCLSAPSFSAPQMSFMRLMRRSACRTKNSCHQVRWHRDSFDIRIQAMQEARLCSHKSQNSTAQKVQVPFVLLCERTEGCLNWKTAARARSGRMTGAYRSLQMQMTGRASCRGFLRFLPAPAGPASAAAPATMRTMSQQRHCHVVAARSHFVAMTYTHSVMQPGDFAARVRTTHPTHTPA